jgi:hypothetical protein
MAYSTRLRRPPWPSRAAATLRPPALLLDHAGDLPKAVPAAGRWQARRAAPGGSRRFREDQHGARHGPAGGRYFRRNFFCPGRPPAREFDIAFLPKGIRNTPGPGYPSSGASHTGHREQRLSLWCPASWSLCPYLPPHGRLHEGFKSFAEIVAATCSNTAREIRYSISNFCNFYQDWVRLTSDGY